MTQGAVSSGHDSPLAPSKVPVCEKKDKLAYPSAALYPTQETHHRVRFDFNFGCRVQLPFFDEGKTCDIRLKDIDTGNILFKQNGIPTELIHSSKRWYVRFGIDVWVETKHQNSTLLQELMFSYQTALRAKEILIQKPYVCIAMQASYQCKYWNNPTGWRELITWFKTQGYRVICIDQKAEQGTGLIGNPRAQVTEYETGNRLLAERARWLKHAAYFVNGSSDLAWLAGSAGCPVVTISGFTHPHNEFEMPRRVINWHTCTSCWNDPKERFDHHDFCGVHGTQILHGSLSPQNLSPPKG